MKRTLLRFARLALPSQGSAASRFALALGSPAAGARFALTLFFVLAAGLTQPAAALPPQPKAIDVAQAFARKPALEEWVKVGGWNYRFTLAPDYFDFEKGHAMEVFCVTAARGEKRAFYTLEFSVSAGESRSPWAEVLTIKRSEQPCANVPRGMFRNPKGGR